jgi:hypothetical protein
MIGLVLNIDYKSMWSTLERPLQDKIIEHRSEKKSETGVRCSGARFMEVDLTG